MSDESQSRYTSNSDAKKIWSNKKKKTKTIHEKKRNM